MTDQDLNTAATAAGVPARPGATEPRRKRPEDTPQGCRALAAADLDRAGAADAGHATDRFRHSAATWTARADMLDRLEAKFRARTHGSAE
ncbi:hypothetical protein [Sphingosinicella terrae]|uniref:hypothetical protein n=1 Tax=Sphingosinicella terrae TaxID=2172047 RepID=UPI000E0CE759|nr:hypothetical protein [Sphingosinicella terrae]